MAKRGDSHNIRVSRDKATSARTSPRRARLNGSAKAAKPPRVPTFSGPAAPAQNAVILFARAMQTLQRHQYKQAGVLFQNVVARFPSERILVDRARVYAELCARELMKAGEGAAPATLEELITAATAALNNGDNDDAHQLATIALRERPDYDLALYIIAAVHARRGEVDTALDRLAHAVAVSPDVRAQARHDADFAPLRRERAFQQLVAEPPRSSQSGTRRLQQPRSER